MANKSNRTNKKFIVGIIIAFGMVAFVFKLVLSLKVEHRTLTKESKIELRLSTSGYVEALKKD